TNIFVGPCIAKKQEAEKNKKDVNFTITFFELSEIINYCKKNKLFKKQDTKTKNTNIDFDKIYNDYTKIYPLSGAVAETMHIKELLTPEQVLVVDGPKNIAWAIKEIEKNKTIKFIDILFCKGGCIGGPGIISKDLQQYREDRVIKYRDAQKKTKMGVHKGKYKDGNKINLKRK
ncbi:MAG: [Fe-Fe] hydrogenase large subunit C-terminal domain-containing protein, partial [archaeon]